MRSHLLLTFAAIVGFSNFAAAASAVDGQGNCTEDFMNVYLTAYGELKTMATYLGAHQPIPNLPEAALACTNLESKYAGVICKVPDANPPSSTVDLTKACDAARTQYTSAAANVQVSDTSPLITLKAAQISVTIVNAAALQSAVDQPSMVFAVDGQLLTMHQAAVSPALVRCTLERPQTSTPALNTGDVWTGSNLDEAFLSETHITELSFANTSVAIRCVTTNTAGVTLGDLKRAFNGLLTVSYGN